MGEALIARVRPRARAARRLPHACRNHSGTPWELDTHGAILVLEDRGMKPYQVDRSLMHLKQAGNFAASPESCSAIFRNAKCAADRESVKDVARRILGRWDSGRSGARRSATRLGRCSRFRSASARSLRCANGGGTRRILKFWNLLGGVALASASYERFVESEFERSCHRDARLRTPEHIHLLGIAGSAMAPSPAC